MPSTGALGLLYAKEVGGRGPLFHFVLCTVEVPITDLLIGVGLSVFNAKSPKSWGVT